MKMMLVVCATGLLAAISPVFAASETISGEVVDVACQKTKGDGGVGVAHIGCIMSCARKGDALGVMTKEGVVYEIAGDYATNNNAKLIEFLASDVEATGDVTTKDGKKIITVTSMKALQ